MKRWKGLLAALLAAIMLTGCGDVAEEVASTALSVAIEEALAEDTESVDEAATEIGAEDENAALVTESGPEITAEEEAAVAASTEADAVDPDFAIDGEEENAALVTGPGPQTMADEGVDSSLNDARGEHSDSSGSVPHAIDEDGYYYDKDSVALYLVTYHKLPGNYITKKEAKRLGWEGGALEPYAHDKAIGGDYFGNYEGTLPDDVEYHECDIDTKGKKRGAKRIIYSENWDIYYTDDHYETFTLLYEGE